MRKGVKNNNKRSSSFPFDWILSTPKAIFELLELLFQDNISIEDLVKNHFLYCEKKASITELEHYFTCCNGGSLYNTKYNIIFPHDIISDDIISDDTYNKYIRRFERLKNTILNTNEELCFIYTSQSSLDSGNFTIDGEKVLHDVYFYLSKIYNLIGKYNNNYKFVVFDAIKEESSEILDKNIILYKVDSCNSCSELISKININLLE